MGWFDRKQVCFGAEEDGSNDAIRTSDHFSQTTTGGIRMPQTLVAQSSAWLHKDRVENGDIWLSGQQKSRNYPGKDLYGPVCNKGPVRDMWVVAHEVTFKPPKLQNDNDKAL